MYPYIPTTSLKQTETLWNCPLCSCVIRGDDCYQAHLVSHAREDLNFEKDVKKPETDPVNAPRHYTSHPSGVECITITEHMGFNLGNALKYLWRADLKNNAMEDLEKAKWYIEREIAKRKKGIA